MSQDKNAEQLNMLFERAYLPTFIEKLASAGVAVKTQEDLEAVLKIAAMTRGAKPAPAQESILKRAAADLERHMAQPADRVQALLQDKQLVAALA